MKHPIRFLVCPLLLATALVRHAAADLIVNGNFTGITNTVAGNNFTYGQFGSNAGPANGAALTVNNWTTSGYNFVYSPGVADHGSTANGADGKVLNKDGTVNYEAPGQSTVTVNNTKYGNEFMWGANNGGTNINATGAANTTNPFATLPFNGNFVAADGAYETGAIAQAVAGLRTGQAYTLTFYWAAAQQESYATATTEQWQVSLGNQTFSTPVYSLPAKGVSPWMQQSFTYTATAASETLSFLAVGTPSGQPPFVLLGGVSLVPEPGSGPLAALVSAGLTAVWFVRRRGRLAAVDAAA